MRKTPRALAAAIALLALSASSADASTPGAAKAEAATAQQQAAGAAKVAAVKAQQQAAVTARPATKVQQSTLAEQQAASIATLAASHLYAVSPAFRQSFIAGYQASLTPLFAQLNANQINYFQFLAGAQNAYQANYASVASYFFAHGLR
jgi:hypothetical protein